MKDFVRTAKRQIFSLSLQESKLIPVLSLKPWRQIPFYTLPSLPQWLTSSNSTLSYYTVSVTDIPLGRRVWDLFGFLPSDRCYAGGRRKKKTKKRNQPTENYWIKRNWLGREDNKIWWSSFWSQPFPGRKEKKEKKKAITKPSPDFSPGYRNIYFAKMEVSQITTFALQLQTVLQTCRA